MQSVVETSQRVEPDAKPYEKNPGKYIMMPGNAKRRHPVVEERLRKLTEAPGQRLRCPASIFS